MTCVNGQRSLSMPTLCDCSGHVVGKVMVDSSSSRARSCYIFNHLSRAKVFSMVYSAKPEIYSINEKTVKDLANLKFARY